VDLSYYSTAGQVIPLLYFALIFQLQVLSRRAQRGGIPTEWPDEVRRTAGKSGVYVVLYSTIVLGAGEIAALWVLRHGHPAIVPRLVVAYSIASALGALTDILIWRTVKDDPGAFHPWMERHVDRLSSLVAFGMAGGAFLFLFY
jgi:hypothetical protein